ncbi:Stemmadenine O-acetyltransferase [Linum perenne]
MEVRIISKELVKPSSPESIQTKPPHKLCLFDQLTPVTFSPLILFYSTPPPSFSINHLKLSLSQTLDIYYPFSGRTSSANLFINNFNEGIPFTLARTHSRLSHFLKHNDDPELLNLLLPRQPFQRENTKLDLPVLELQLSVFSCGGIAFGWAASHKLVDGSTMKAFLDTFSAISRGNRNDIVSPDLFTAAELFPPRVPSPDNYLNLMETLWFTEGDYLTRRFVFDSNSISILRSMATASKLSRVEALSCFIWKCCMSASKAVGRSSKTSILVEAVNLRSQTDPALSEASIGDVFWWGTAMANPNDETENEMSGLGSLVSEAIGLYKSEYVKSLQGGDGFESMSGYFEQLEGLFEEEKPDIFGFTSWCGFGFTGEDFGWGKPVWVTVMGKVGRAFRNLTIFVDSTERRGSIEAWVTLDRERMVVLERDPYFLEFASTNPRISSL